MTEHTDSDPKAEANYQARMRKQWALEATTYLLKLHRYVQVQNPDPGKDRAIKALSTCIQTLHQEIISNG